jgi:hypothetical protein
MFAQLSEEVKIYLFVKHNVLLNGIAKKRDR